MDCYFKIFAVFAAFALSSCSSTVQTMQAENTEKFFTSADSFYVFCSNNGSYNGHEYPQSAFEASTIVYNALLRHSDNVEKSQGIVPRGQALKEAKSAGLKYLAGVQILQWEDRVSSWLGVPDKVEIKISMIEVSSGKTLRSAVISGEGPLYTFGNDYPQDLLVEPIRGFFAEIFKK